MRCIPGTASLQRRNRKHAGHPTAGPDVPRRPNGNHRSAGMLSFIPREFSAFPDAAGALPAFELIGLTVDRG
jgi:hypothetical protein